jgi:hypothetical protein
MAKESSIATRKEETDPSAKGQQDGSSGAEVQSSEQQQHSLTPSKRDHDQSAAPENKTQPARSSNRSDPSSSTTPSTSSFTVEEFPPKRPKREWLAFHGVKHTRVGSEYQVTILPSEEATANKTTNDVTKASSLLMDPKSSLPQRDSENGNDRK